MTPTLDKKTLRKKIRNILIDWRDTNFTERVSYPLDDIMDLLKAKEK